MKMPEGWERLKEDDVNHPEAADLMREMAEALELYESGKALYPSMGSGGPAYLVLKKFKEWK